MELGTEGALALRLTLEGDRIREVTVTSSRPVRASAVFQGRDPGEVVGLLPTLFGVCGTAQTVAGLEALEQAGGVEIGPHHAGARAAAVAMETAREHLARILLDWPGRLGDGPWTGHAARGHRLPAEMRRALYPDGDFARLGGGRLAPDGGALTRVREELEALLEEAFGCAPGRFLRLEGLAGLNGLLEEAAASAPAPAFLRRLREPALAGWGASGAVPLPDPEPEALAGELAADEEGRFAARPQWDGSPRETGPLIRQEAHPLVVDAVHHYGRGVLARQLARLVELAALPAALTPEGGGGPCRGALVPGTGLGTVEAARGRLDHYVELAGDTIRRYRILAPTEWNFHPRGVLAEGLAEERVPAGETAEGAARLLVEAVDPCVACEVEVTHA